jgi:hypothetical protein
VVPIPTDTMSRLIHASAAISIPLQVNSAARSILGNH